MGKRGRPRSTRTASALTTHIKLRLYPGEDDDLIAFFRGIPLGLRAAMVKRGLWSGMADTPSPSVADDDDLLDAMDAFIS